MNIEEILPELFGEKRVYYCQRCLNHGHEVKRKNHKADCAYRFCICTDCQMVDRRRELNSRLMQIEDASSLQSIGNENNVETASASSEPPLSPHPVKGKERRPNCQRCAQHSVQARLKGHKRCCPFRDCPCAKCQVVQERQKLMADQIKLRRRQKKQKRMDVVTDPDATHSPVVEGSVHIAGCMKCAQQAFGYQRLLSFLDPTVVLEPAVFSAILAACPHTN
ncbi:Protein male abnormal 3 [Toxocara canis]|uniref:Protein male abnormal 3 n=1 Tax=Toxocara canis TaxID=6265 RepID=A0A0B2VJH1_TOXCA|nr:Protein male abnormal 3 [Toxocara canis]